MPTQTTTLSMTPLLSETLQISHHNGRHARAETAGLSAAGLALRVLLSPALTNAILTVTILVSAVLFTAESSADDIELPSLGDSITGIMPPSQEKVLGQAWLRSFRASTALNDDVVVYEYIEDLLLQLASHSDLDEKSIDLVVVDNPAINAFAVPGGVVGVHTGLISAASDEAQIASVLTHELAHLSQRHFARSMDAAKRANVTSILGALAGIAIAAGGGSGDAVSAALITSQAAAIDSRLRYSRNHEREADRLGMRSLVDAGYAASGATRMFQEMQNASRLYGRRIPEFLLTHPVTQSRIAEARQRERQFEREAVEAGRILDNTADSLSFQLIKARLYVNDSDTKRDAIKHFKFQLKQAEEELQKSSLSERAIQHTTWQRDAARYGLALAYNDAGEVKKARKAIEPLLQEVPGRIIYSLLDIEIEIKDNNMKVAERRLRDLYSLNPDNFGISMTLAKLLQNRNKAKDAEKVLTNLSKQRPTQANVWYHLAEAQGKSGNTIGLHRSRAEFFLLNGRFDHAVDHLKSAYRLAGDDFKLAASIRQRVNEMVAIKKQQDSLGFG